MYAFLHENNFDKHACCGKCLRSNFYVNQACIDTIRINLKKNVLYPSIFDSSRVTVVTEESVKYTKSRMNNIMLNMNTQIFLNKSNIGDRKSRKNICNLIIMYRCIKTISPTVEYFTVSSEETIRVAFP